MYLFSLNTFNVNIPFAVILQCTHSCIWEMQFHINISIIVFTIGVWSTQVMDTLGSKRNERQVAEQDQRVVSAEPQLIG